MMSKRSSDSTSTKPKRKRVALSITDKVTLLKILDEGASAKLLGDEYGVGLSTIYDIKKQKDKLLQFYGDSDSPKLLESRKTLHQSQNVTVDKVLMEWIRQRRSEKFPLTRSLIMAQAKIFHEMLQIQTKCECSSGWYGKFRKRNGLRILSVCGEKASADYEAAEEYSDYFCDFVKQELLTAEQIYNADETSLLWRYLPRKTVVTADEPAPTGFKDSKERLTVLACSNAAGTHKTELLVIGKSRNPRALKGVKIYPVVYQSSKNAWITKEIFKVWFKQNFIPEARAHCTSVGLAADAKILLVIDNCSAHPDAEFLAMDNVFAIFLPPNCTSVIQPLDQGILRALKTYYKNDFLMKMLTECNKGVGVKDFLKTFTIKDALWSAAKAWDAVEKHTLIHGWYNLWPPALFLDDDESEAEFEGFKISKEKKIIADLLEYAKNLSCPEAKYLNQETVEDCLNADENSPITFQMTDSEICDMIKSDEKSDESDDDDDDQENVSEKISNEKMIFYAEQLIAGMQQRSYFHEQQVMSVYKIQEQLVKETRYKQKTIIEMFSKLKSKDSAPK